MESRLRKPRQMRFAAIAETRIVARWMVLARHDPLCTKHPWRPMMMHRKSTLDLLPCHSSSGFTTTTSWCETINTETSQRWQSMCGRWRTARWGTQWSGRSTGESPPTATQVRSVTCAQRRSSPSSEQTRASRWTSALSLSQNAGTKTSTTCASSYHRRQHCIHSTLVSVLNLFVGVLCGHLPFMFPVFLLRFSQTYGFWDVCQGSEPFFPTVFFNTCPDVLSFPWRLGGSVQLFDLRFSPFSAFIGVFQHVRPAGFLRASSVIVFCHCLLPWFYSYFYSYY